MSLLDLLLDHPFADDDPLVHTVASSFTKADMVERVERYAATLDVANGSPIPVVADGIDALIAMFGCWRAGAVYVPINPRQPEAAIEKTTARTADLSAPDAAFVLWTSGTTGEPKPILHSHDAYLEIIDRVLAPLRAAPVDRSRPPSPNLIPVSMALNAGMYNALFGLRAGAPLVLMDHFDTSTFVELVQRHEIRSTVLPPAAMTMLNDDASITSLHPLRYVRSITAPLSPFQAQRFTDRFEAFVLNGYGQAEIGEVIGWTTADAKAHPDRIGAVGRPHAGVEIRIAEPDDNGVGELLVRPPSTAIDLADDRVTTDGFVRTGDLARIDDADFVWIEGRAGDLINRGGNKVFPREVEEVLRSVAGVDDVAVFAASDERLGEVPVAAIVGDVDDEVLDTTVRANLAPYKAPTVYHHVTALPRSEVGKVLRRRLAEELA